MLFLVTDAQIRPNMLEDKKDEDYHLRFGRYCIGQANNQRHVQYVEKIRLNKDFFKGNQWTSEEDLEAFFKDDTGQNRNRIKVIDNIIKPMVNAYKGNAIRMSINARVKSISPKARDRREQKLEAIRFFSNVANTGDNPFKDDLKKQYPIGNSDGETEDIFNSLYIDSYVENINYLLDFVSQLNEFDKKQVILAESLALSGIAIMKDQEYNGHQRFNFVEPDNFYWDRSGKEPNLSDAEFMGEVFYLTPSEIFEIAPDLSPEDRAGIEMYARQFHKTNTEFGTSLRRNSQSNKYESGGRVPVFYNYWRDTSKHEYGYVKDEFGYDKLTRINYTYEGEENPRYTDKDLIQVNSIKSRRLLKGKLKTTMMPDSIRKIIFIPKEVLASVSSNDKENSGLHDIILEWGVLEYQETEELDPNNCKFPYKCYTWAYVDGEVLTPIDDAINPQRMINRLKSIAENQINNSRGSGVFYDKSMIDPQEGEDGLLRNMNQSKPVGLAAKGRGIQNAVVPYDNTVGKGTNVMYDITQIMKNSVKESTGMNDALQGQSTGNDQLVGVTELMIQKGSLLQEPFYNAITEVYLQCYQAIATRGKRIYADNEREFIIAVGDNGYKTLKITKDMKLEDFRCFVRRENTDDILINAGNQMLMQFLQLQLIDQEKFAALYNRSSPEQIAAALRKQALDNKEVQRMQAEEEQKQNEVINQKVEEEKQQQQMQLHEMEAKQDINTLSEQKQRMKEIALKQLAHIAKENPTAQQEILNINRNLNAGQPVA
ncbi:MAG TPA: portal protein [Candidatus Wunengus sp. YC60]|uniref:portal protein n=1 Tax=Candidatus Wunengus sp. YC60 TaxID=3367697 RepID=UPI004027C592